MSKVSRGEKGEELVISSLNKIKEYHHLLNDVTFVNDKSEMTHQIDHILIHPHGVFVIETKNYYGKITLVPHETYWIKEVNKEKVKISNPLKQNKSHQVMVNRILKGNFDVVSLVVFVKNNAPYMPDDNVINLEDLLLFIESYPFKKKISKTDIDKIGALLQRKTQEIDRETHIENIGYLKQMKEEFRQEMSFAIENNICPRCKSKIVRRGYIFQCSKCDFNFKL